MIGDDVCGQECEDKNDCPRPREEEPWAMIEVMMRKDVCGKTLVTK